MPDPSTPKRTGRGQETDAAPPTDATAAQDAAVGTVKRRGSKTAWPEKPRRENTENSIGIDRPRDRESPGSSPANGSRVEGSRSGTRFDAESVLTESIREK